MKAGIGIAAAPLLLLAGCNQGSETRHISAVVDANLETGEALLTCRESSSGICYALYVTEAQTITAKVKAGETGGTQGLSPATRYCIDVAAPDTGKCRPRPLTEGQQIYRSNTIEKH